MSYVKKSNKIVFFEIICSLFFALIIFLIASIIFANTYLNSVKISKNAEATSIMTNILENMQKRTFKEFRTYIEELSIVGISKQLENEVQLIFINGSECQEKFFGTDILKDYNLVVEISDTDKNFEMAKNVNIVISYIIFGKSYSLEMDTLIEREKIKEVNDPVINNEYFKPLNTEEYYIIPIKYSYNSNSYVITTAGDPDWYNYSAKEWAKVLVFEKSGDIQKELFIDFNGNISKQINYNGKILNLYDYVYTWIPNFSKKDNETYFRYGSGKNSIKMEYLNESNKYLYFYSISDEIENISTECSFNGVSGVWKKVFDTNDNYYKTFSQTKYGPINLH